MAKRKEADHVQERLTHYPDHSDVCRRLRPSSFPTFTGRITAGIPSMLLGAGCTVVCGLLRCYLTEGDCGRIPHHGAGLVRERPQQISVINNTCDKTGRMLIHTDVVVAANEATTP